jgi:hypothetical protein
MASSTLIGPGRHAKLSDSAAIDPTRGLPALTLLELDQGLPRARAEHAIGLNRKASVDQHKLHLPNLVRAQVNGNITAAAANHRAAAARRIDRDHRHNATPIIQDDDLVAHDEVLVATKFRTDLHDGVGDRHHSHPRRNDGADCEIEVDAGHTRNVRSGKHALPDAGALLDIELHTTSRRSSVAALYALTALRAILLLAALAYGAVRFTALVGLRLRLLVSILIALRFFALSFVALRLVTLSPVTLTLFALSLSGRLLVPISIRLGLRLLFGFALVWLTLLTLARLFTLTLLALTLFALALARGLLTAIPIGLGLGLPALARVALTLTTFSALTLRHSLPLLALTALRALRSLALGRSSL